LKVLFDQGTPVPLRRALVGCDVQTAFELGWSRLRNGELIAAAKGAGFEVFVTTDRNLKYQQNLTGRRMALVVLMTTSWPRLQLALPEIRVAVNGAEPGSYVEVSAPAASR